MAAHWDEGLVQWRVHPMGLGLEVEWATSSVWNLGLMLVPVSELDHRIQHLRAESTVIYWVHL